MSLVPVPITITNAKSFVNDLHRHNKAPAGAKFAIGCNDGDKLVGVVMVGRPVARVWDDGFTAEVIRNCTDGTYNACSLLYGAAWRAARAMGYTRIVTYTQGDEGGASLRASGWQKIADRKPHAGWSRNSRPREDVGSAGVPRIAWEITSQ